MKKKATWKETWLDPAMGASVSLNEATALVRMDFVEPCAAHKKGIICLACLPKMEAALAAARRALDPGAPGHVTDAATSDEFPRIIALWNPIGAQGFAMRLDQPQGLVSRKLIMTSDDPSSRVPGKVILMDHTTESAVCDAILAKAFRVSLKEGTPPASGDLIGDAKFTLSLDGINMVENVTLKHLLTLGEIPLSRPQAKDCCLFSAHPIKDIVASPRPFLPRTEKEAIDLETWLGCMLPNGTRIVATLEGVPGGCGTVEVEVSLKMANYTTKAEE